MKMLLAISCMLTMVFYNPQLGTAQTRDKELAVIKAKSTSKFINNFDFDCDYFLMTKAEGTSTAKVSIDPIVKHEGNGSLKCELEFTDATDNKRNERVTLRKIWGNYRSDLSFHPLGLSLWIKSSALPTDKLNINLLQQNEAYTLTNDSLKIFSFSNAANLGKADWQQIIIPYSYFKAQNSKDKINLHRVVGYEFTIENATNKPHKVVVNFDSFEQLTSYKPAFKKNSKFSSIFIQLSAKQHENFDWASTFKSYKEVGIDTVIIQHAIRNDKTGSISHYNGTKLPGIVKQYHMLENVFDAANKTGMRVILGLNAGKYPEKKSEAAVYKKLLETNKIIIDELYDKFSDNKLLAGWYIAEEYHDGFWRGWWKPEDAYLLSDYQEKVAAYAKSKPKKFLVAIAPALWRGRPADMTYDFYKRILQKTPSIDILYLQDCAGRRNIVNDDLIVDLPNYFAMVKKACDETGVQFGVDIESFTKGNCKTIYGTKNWKDLKLLVDIAGMFTQNISQFSWASFRPGVGAFDDYKKYVKELK